MAITFSLFWFIFVAHAYPSASPPINSAENLFPTSYPDVSDDGIFADNSINTSIFLPENSPADDSIFGVSDLALANIDAGTYDTSLFRGEKSPSEDSDLSVSDLSLTNVVGGSTEPLLETYPLASNSLLQNFDPLPVAINYDSDGSPISDSSPVGSYCEDSPVDTEDTSLKNDSNEDFSLNKESHANGPARTYPLDPNTEPFTRTSEAYAPNGIPIQPQKCPAGKHRSCCIWDSIPPFSRCWRSKKHEGVCPYAKNEACCTSVPLAGQPGVDCENAKWVKSRDGRAARGKEPNNSSFRTQLQGLFPIFQDLPPLPDSNLSPAYCKPRSK